jgi:hypothetical protein
MYIQTFTNGRMPVPYPLAAPQGTPREEDRTSPKTISKSLDSKSNGSGLNGTNSHSVFSNNSSHPGERTKILTLMKFQNPYGACNFIVTWNGEDADELLDAIRYARESGDRFIQDKLIEYILNIPLRHPRPLDIPAFVGRPVWAVDNHGHAIIGMPGAESIVDVEWLRQQLHHA